MNKGSMTPATIYCPNEMAEYRSDARKWQGIPGIERSRGGRLFAAWYSGGKTEEPGNVIILEKSDDNGETWSEGFAVVRHDDPEVRCFDECLWIDPKGRLWLCWTQSLGYFDGRDGVWCAVCDDPDAEALTFGVPRRIANGLMMNKPTVTSKGEWLFPCAVWWKHQSVASEEHPEVANEVGSNVYVSTDEGATFTFRGGADVPDRAFDEHMLVERGDGTLWVLVRTHHGIGQAFSDDGGATWRDAGFSGHHGPDSRFFIRRLASGRLLLVNHVNPGFSVSGDGTRCNLMAMLSGDDGKTWRGGLMLDTRAGVSYPDGCQAPDGSIDLIYDFDRYGAREIVRARFTEEDILAGRLVSPGSQLQQLVNRATGAK